MEFSTREILELFALLVSVGTLLALSPVLRVPLPILLVLGGVVLSFIPGLPHITLPPDIVLVAILPPLLYSRAFFTFCLFTSMITSPGRSPRSAARRPAARAAGGKAVCLARMVREAPRLTDPKGSRARVDAWFAEIAARPAGKALKRLVAASAKLEALLAALADGSPFLWELVTADAARLLAILESDPDAHFSALLAKTSKAVAAPPGSRPTS